MNCELNSDLKIDENYKLKKQLSSIYIHAYILTFSAFLIIVYSCYHYSCLFLPPVQQLLYWFHCKRTICLKNALDGKEKLYVD